MRRLCYSAENKEFLSFSAVRKVRLRNQGLQVRVLPGALGLTSALTWHFFLGTLSFYEMIPAGFWTLRRAQSFPVVSTLACLITSANAAQARSHWLAVQHNYCIDHALI